MNKDVILFTAAAFGLVTAAHAASSETADTADDAAFNVHVGLWRSFDVPRAAKGTQPTNINDRGEITGVYFDAKGNQHGFLRKESGKIETFDAPGVGYPAQTSSGAGTIPTGINDGGEIVGYYSDEHGAYHGFVRSAHGKFKIIDDPSSTSSPPATMPNAINDWGVIVGNWYDANGNYHGFVRQVDGSYTTVDAPGNVTTGLYHINDRNEVAGETSDADNVSHGVLLHCDGKVVTFEAPHAASTFGGFTQALNFWGAFAGEYEDAKGGVHAYVRYSDGRFHEFTAPRAGTTNGEGTYSSSLNLAGISIGFSYESNGSADGYVHFRDGPLILANAPVAGQQSTFPYAINDLDEFTGFWFDAGGAEHGFVALAVR